MGYSGYLFLKNKARKLRKKGFSIRSIQKKVKVSKSTISIWTRDIKLTKKQLLKLYKSKKVGQLKGSIIGAKNQQKTRIEKTKELNKLGRKEIGRLSKRDRFIIGIGLYSAEGTKGDRYCAFANSDPKLISFMCSWFREFCKIPENKLRGALWIHDNLDKKIAENFWTKITKIPLSQFHKTYVTENKTKSKKIRKNIHKYGVFSIRFVDASIHRKLMGWIQGILK